MSVYSEQASKDEATQLKEAIENAYSAVGVTVKITETMVHKNNETVKALTVTKPGEDDSTVVSPTIYPRNYEKDINAGVPLDEIGEKIKQQVDLAYENSPKLPVFTPEEAEKHIRMVLINKTENPEIVKNTPHYDIGDTDITAIPRWFMDAESGPDTASFIVNNDVARTLHMTGQEVIDLGYKNTQSETFKVRSMEEVMAEIMGPEFAAIMPPSETPEMIVINNDSGLYGASGIINERAMEQVAEKLGTDEFFIIPSSVHETIAIKSEGNNPEDVKKMIRDVNATEVSRQDFLSNELMKYKGGRIELAIKPKIDKPIVVTPNLEIKHKMKM